MKAAGWHLVELDALLVSLGAGVWHPQRAEFCPEQVGRVLLHAGDVEAEDFGRYSLGTVGKVICNGRGQRTAVSFL